MKFSELEGAFKARNGTRFGPASSAQISDAEKQLNVEFTEGLREYLRIFGWLELGHLEFFGLGPGVPGHLDLVRMTLSERHEVNCPVPVALIPLLNDGAGNLLCVDTKRESPTYKSILFWDHDMGADQTPSVWAPDIETWLTECFVLVEDVAKRFAEEDAAK